MLLSTTQTVDIALRVNNSTSSQESIEFNAIAGNNSSVPTSDLLRRTPWCGNSPDTGTTERQVQGGARRHMT